MNNPRYYFGNYIKIHQINDFFDHVRIMLLEHFDKPSYTNVLFVIGSTSIFSCRQLKEENPDYKLILYQLEQFMDGSNWNTTSTLIKNMEGADEIWDYDELNALYLKNKYNIQVNKIVPLLYTQNLDLINNKKDPNIDVLFYGYLNDRRYKILRHIQHECFLHLKIVWVFGTIDLNRYIEDSKIILNLHAFEPWSRQEQVRLFYPIINSKTIVSERSQLNYFGDSIVEEDTVELPRKLKSICYNGTWRTIGSKAKQDFITRTNNFLKTNNLI